MAELTIKQHDTWPPIRGRAADQNGALALQTASSLKFLAKQGAPPFTLISGAAAVISPADSEGMNWSYTLSATDTAVPGTYAVELEITWDAGTSPPHVETVPNAGTELLVIEPDQG